MMSNANQMSAVRASYSEAEREQEIFTFKASELVWLFLGILEGLIAVRIGLMLIGANPNSPVAALIYGITGLFLFPFTGLIASPTAGNLVLDLWSMFAMLVFALIAWAVERIIWLVFYRPRSPEVVLTKTTTHKQNSNQ